MAVLAIVVESLDEACRSLDLTSSLFYNLGKEIRYRHLTFDLACNGLAQIDRQCERIESEGLLWTVRTITFALEEKTNFWSKRVNTPIPISIYRLIPMMTGLESVAYNEIAPKDLLETLNDLPRVRLHTVMDTENTHTLHGNTNLSSLDLQLGARACLNGPLYMSRLKGLIISCPNIRRLSINIPEDDGCGAFDEDYYAGLGFAVGDKLPVLEELETFNYEFGGCAAKDDTAWERYLAQSQLRFRKREVDFWYDSFDWSRLRVLCTDRADFAERLAPKLVALQEFVDRSWGPSNPTFCDLVPSILESISAPTLKHVTLNGILRHSSRLKRLQLHQEEHTSWREDCIDFASLQSIQRECALLTDLSLDLSQSEFWPYAAFNVLAAFPNLRRLQIWFQSPRRAECGLPTLDHAAAVHIFKYIRSCSSQNGFSHLRRVTLHPWGASPAGRVGGSFRDPNYAAPPIYICELSANDREAAAGVFSVKTMMASKCSTAFDMKLVPFDRTQWLWRSAWAKAYSLIGELEVPNENFAWHNMDD